MKLFRLVCFIFFSITATLSSHQTISEKYIQKTVEKKNEQFYISNAPSWVREVDYEEEDIEENIDSTGVAYLLYNKQYNLEKKVHYTRKVKKFVSKAILTEACTISITFDFKQQDLAIHHLKIIRRGEVIEKLPTVKSKCFYPSASTANNLQQIIFYVDNLRVGDIIDIAYSLREKDNFLIHLFQGDSFNLPDLSLYKKIVYDCFIGKDRPIFWKTYLFDQDPICSFRNGYKVYSWEIKDYNIEWLPVNHETTRSPSIAISTSTWNDIAKYLSISFKEKSKFFPAPPENIVKLIKEWGELYSTQEEQILAAIRFVSDDIYYLSIPDEEKEHYMTPYPPHETLEKHYGDCKDKTYLLIALLRLLDVEAYPVLVHTNKTYKNELPHCFFDHVIVNIIYEGKSYFVDPTLSLQGGTLKTYQIPDYGYGLVLREDSEDLLPITRSFLSKVHSMATLSIQGEDISWDHITKFYHHQADTLRRALVLGYLARKDKATLSYLNNEFPNAQIAYTSPSQIEDDRQANIITKKSSLLGKNIGMKTTTGFLYDLSFIISDVVATDDIDFSKLFFLESLGIREIYKTIAIHCDKTPNIEEKRVSYIDDNLSYSLTIEKISVSDIRVVLHQEILKDYIETEELPHLNKKLEEFTNHLHLKIEISD